MKPQITIEEFLELDLRVGEVREVGEAEGIKKWYTADSLLNKKDDEAVLYNFDKDIKNGTTIH